MGRFVGAGLTFLCGADETDEGLPDMFVGMACESSIVVPARVSCDRVASIAPRSLSNAASSLANRAVSGPGPVLGLGLAMIPCDEGGMGVFRSFFDETIGEGLVDLLLFN